VPIQKEIADIQPAKSKIRMIGLVIIQLNLFEICLDSSGNFWNAKPRSSEENVIKDRYYKNNK